MKRKRKQIILFLLLRISDAGDSTTIEVTQFSDDCAITDQ